VFRTVALLILLSALSPVGSFAADSETRPAPREFPVTNFPKGTSSVSLVGAYAHSFEHERERIETVAVGAGYYVFNNIAINAEFAGFFNQQNVHDAQIAEMNFLLRHHLINYNRFSLLADVGGGVSYSTAHTPARHLLQLHPPDRRRRHFPTRRPPPPHRRRPLPPLLQRPDRRHQTQPGINAAEGYVGLLFTF